MAYSVEPILLLKVVNVYYVLKILVSMIKDPRYYKKGKIIL